MRYLEKFCHVVLSNVVFNKWYSRPFLPLFWFFGCTRYHIRVNRENKWD